MPACLTHYQFARKGLTELPAQDKENLNSCAFYWGAQGPDFFFCHRYFPWMKGKSLKEYGNKLHGTKPSLTFSALRDFLVRHSDPVYRSYVMGFLCHYALDSTAHPYINAFAETLLRERPYETHTTLHGEIEAALDAIVLRRETGLLPNEVNLKHMFPKNEAVQRRIAKLFRHVLFEVYHVDVKEEELLRATRDAHFVFACLTDRTTLKKKLFDALEKGKPHYVSSHIVPMTETADIDYANLQGEEWKSGEGTSQQSFFDLFEEAMGKAVILITNFEHGDFAELTQEKPFG